MQPTQQSLQDPGKRSHGPPVSTNPGLTHPSPLALRSARHTRPVLVRRPLAPSTSHRSASNPHAGVSPTLGPGNLSGPLKTHGCQALCQVSLLLVISPSLLPFAGGGGPVFCPSQLELCSRRGSVSGLGSHSWSKAGPVWLWTRRHCGRCGVLQETVPSRSRKGTSHGLCPSL